MPLSSTNFAPGFDKQSTASGADGKWTDGENIRFRYGKPEKIGGWEKLFNDKLIGAVRDIHAWVATDGTKHLAFGTDKKLYVYKEGLLVDVTPIRATQADLSNPFVTTSGSAVVTVTDPSHGALAGDFVTFTNASDVGGLSMNAEFQITSIVDSDTYTVTHSSNASSGATGGGSSTVDCAYQIAPGQATNVYGFGWGISSWNGTISPFVTDQLAAAITSATATSITVDTGSKFAANDYIMVGQEIMKVSSVSSNTLTVIRGLSSITDTTSVSAVGSHDNTTHLDNALVTMLVDASASTTTVGWNVAATTSGTVLESRYWVFDNFGEDLLALVNNGSLFKWDTSSGTDTRAAIVDANAPTASRFLLVSSDKHVFLMGTETTIGTDSSQEDLFLRFSNQDDTGTWIAATDNTAGAFSIQDGSRIMTAARSRGSVLVWTDSSLHALQFIGPPDGFGLSQIGSNCGAISPHCAIDVNGNTFWMSQQAFYMFDGGVKKLACSVQDYVFDDFSLTQQQSVYVGLNTDYNELTWFYASKDSETIDRCVTYNYAEQVWSTNSMSRTTWLDRTVYDNPYATEYDTTVAGTNPTVLGLSVGASYVYTHEIGTDDDGAAMECFLQSGDFDIQDGEQLLSIKRFIPDFKDQVGSADVLLSFKNYSATTTEDTLNGAITSGATSLILTSATNFPSSGTVLIGTELITYTGKSTNTLTGLTRGTSSTTAAAHVDNKKVINYSNVRINLNTVTPTTTKIDTRGRGRQANILISSNALGDDWRFGTLRLDYKPDGGR